MKIYSLDNCEISNKNGLYGGVAGSKDGIIINGDNWMVKYPKSTKSMNDVEISYTTSPLCEFLGSHIYKILGYDVHETILGVRHNKLVVACKDFTDKNTVLAEIRTIKNHANEILSEKLNIDFESTGDSHGVELETLIAHIRYNPILTKISNVEERFFEQAIIDIYINNNDRNNGNWGILRHLDGTPDTLAPIYDNGGSFHDKLSTEKAKSLLQNISLAKEYACGTQTAYKDKEGHVYSISKFLALQKDYPKLKEAIKTVIPLIEKNQQKIKELINDIPNFAQMGEQKYFICSNEVKELYKVQLDARFVMLKKEYTKTLDKQISSVNESYDNEQTLGKIVNRDNDWER